LTEHDGEAKSIAQGVRADLVPRRLNCVLFAMKNEREIIQLWSAATLYWGLVPSNLSPNSLAMTISQWEKVCQKWKHPKLTPELEFTAHLASCAILLYSVDELGKYSRYTDYHDWWNNRQKGRRFFTIQNTRKIIHCVLRNLVAHDEHKHVSLVRPQLQ
jgi:hypothetical protein